MSELRFDGLTAIITGAGQGLGRSYALDFARRGANVVVNDNKLLEAVDGKAPVRTADLTVAEIREFGGKAIASYEHCMQGRRIVQEAIQAFGGVHILVNNAGILLDSSFQKMSKENWEKVYETHLKGTFMMTSACWPHFRAQKFGRIINTSSVAGIHGNFGQANYSTAKLGIHGFTNTIAREGERRNILCNTIAPLALTGMTQDLLPKEVHPGFSTEFITPLVICLAHPTNKRNRQLYAAGGSWMCAFRWEKTEGITFDTPFTVDNLAPRFEEILDFSKPQYTKSFPEAQAPMWKNYQRNLALRANKTGSSGLKSALIFDLIAAYLEKGEGANAVKVCNATYNIEIIEKKKGPVVQTWGIDLKNGGGMCGKKFDKPDASFKFIDTDFYKVCMGELNPQVAFLQGKMKIKGNMKAATAFTPALFPKPTTENFAKYGFSPQKL